MHYHTYIHEVLDRDVVVLGVERLVVQRVAFRRHELARTVEQVLGTLNLSEREVVHAVRHVDRAKVE